MNRRLRDGRDEGLGRKILTREDKDDVEGDPSTVHESAVREKRSTDRDAYDVGWVHVQFGQNHNKRIAFCRRHCFAPLFAACLTARRVKVGFVHSHDCRACTNPTGVVWLQSDGE